MIKLIKIGGSTKYLVDILHINVEENDKQKVTITLTDGSSETIEYTGYEVFKRLLELIDHNMTTGASITVYQSESEFEEYLRSNKDNVRKPGENPRPM